MLPQSKQDLAAQKKDDLRKKDLSAGFAAECSPTNWELDSHPAYEDLDPGIRDFVRKRYKHWAPKVSWIFRLWFHLCRMNAHLAAEWPTRSAENSDEAVRLERRKRACDYFWDGMPPHARLHCPTARMFAHSLLPPPARSQQMTTTSPWRPSATPAARPGTRTTSATSSSNNSRSTATPPNRQRLPLSTAAPA